MKTYLLLFGLFIVLFALLGCSEEIANESSHWQKAIEGEETLSTEVPSRASLHQPYPTPFQDTVHIAFDLAEDSDVLLIVQNLVGDHILTLIATHLEAGYRTVAWDGSGASGIKLDNGFYFITLSTSGFTQSRLVQLKR